MDETLASTAIKKRLGMQNEVLKWLMEFSDKLQKKAEAATTEVNGLLDQTGAVERDLKNTFNSFCNLSYHRFINHEISDEDVVGYHMKESAKRPDQAGIPAQNYETDILPRYKEALSLGLSSCENHLKSTKRSHSTSSVFRTGSTHGPLPHIIGSEEYIHDNSCGLTGDFALRTSPYDFSGIVESKGLPPDSEKHESPDLFGTQEGYSEKDETEPLVSAALDFRAMLEAALLNPYKFYDDESMSGQETVSNDRSVRQIHEDVDSVTLSAPHASSFVGLQQLDDTEEKAVPSTSTHQTSLQDPDIPADELLSALVTGSLFDADEDSLFAGQKNSLDIPASGAGSISGHADTIDANVHAKTSKNEASGSLDYTAIEQTGADASANISPLEDIDALERDITISTLSFSPCRLNDAASSSSADCGNNKGANKELSIPDRLVTETLIERQAGGSPETVQDLEGPNSSTQSACDIQLYNSLEGSSIVDYEERTGGVDCDGEE